MLVAWVTLVLYFTLLWLFQQQLGLSNREWGDVIFNVERCLWSVQHPESPVEVGGVMPL